MKKARQKLLDAHREAQLAEARFKTTLETAKAEFRPANVAGTAVQGAKDKIGDAAGKAGRAVTSRPATIIAAGAAIGLFFFRKPIAAAIRKRISGRDATRTSVQPLTDLRTNGSGPIKDPTPRTTMIEEV